MGFFRFRWPGRQKHQGENRETSASGHSDRVTARPVESVELIRRRALHRLIGAAVLVLLGVVVFPLVFDTQPRPIKVEMELQIPDRHNVAPLVLQEEPVIAMSPMPPEQGSAEWTVVPEVSEDVGEFEQETHEIEVETAGNTEITQAVEKMAQEAQRQRPQPPSLQPVPRDEPSASMSPAQAAKTTSTKLAPARSASANDAARARVLLNADHSSAPVVVARHNAAKPVSYMVQVGAFADEAKAHQVRAKLERAGLKVYVQSVNTVGGKRTRVRLGPFSSESEAEKAAARAAGVGFSGAKAQKL